MPFAAPAVAMIAANAGTISAAATVAGTAASAYGAYSSAQQQRAYANAQATGAFYQGNLDATQYGYQSAVTASKMLYDSELSASSILGESSLASMAALLRGDQNALEYRYAALNATGQAAQADNEAALSRMRQAAAKFNADVAERSAQQELVRGEQAGAQTGLAAGLIKSSQRAGMAASGVDLGEGSAAEVLAGTDIMKMVDMNTIAVNAARAAWGQRVEKMNFLNQASMERVSEIGLMDEAAMQRLNAQGMMDFAALSETQGRSLAALFAEYGANAAAVEREQGMVAAGLIQSAGAGGAAYLRGYGAQRGRLINLSASGISPGASAGLSLLGDVARAAPQWYQYYKEKK